MLAQPPSESAILQGDCRTLLRTLNANCIHCVVTSPPYFGLRDYGHGEQIGLEQSPQQYVEQMVNVFREVRRVLRDDGTCWLNLGDSYARALAKSGSGPNGKNEDRWGYGDAKSRVKDKTSKQASNSASDIDGVPRHLTIGSSDGAVGRADRPGSRSVGDGLKPKDLIGIPWRVALALQQDGWYLRQDIIWHKPNPMPESVRDRCTKAHEYLFMLTKSEKYFYDCDAVKEPSVKGYAGSKFHTGKTAEHQLERASKKPREGNKQDGVGKRQYTGFNACYDDANPPEMRNRRSVWTISTKPYKEAHFATFPPDLVEPCIKAGSPLNGVVLDPFAGAGTTGVVAKQLHRHFLGFELNPDYVKLAQDRIAKTP